jgi:hypothetical protein
MSATSQPNPSTPWTLTVEHKGDSGADIRGPSLL